MNSHYFNGLDEYDLDNEESIRSKWKETRGCKIGLDSQNFQPFRKDFLHNNKENYMMTEDRIEAFYREKEIIIKTFENQQVPSPYLSWASANFPPPILDSIEQLQFKCPTLIQSVVFPIILAGYDVIGIAQTGSGKTIAYLLPGLIQITSQRNEELINTKKQNSPQMLILVPTRELAIQIDSEIQLFTQNYRLKTVCVYGGLNNRKTQYINLGRSPNILVATPGRLLDFLKERATTLSDVSYLVIDEADRLLEMGFEDTIREIVQQIRQDRQTVFFSATWPKAVKNLAFDFCQQIPIYVQIGKSNLTINKNIEQEIICLFQKDKLQSLLEILDTLKISDKVLIFSDQRYRCEQLALNMAEMGYYTIALHGDKTQPQREEIMKAFRSGQTRLLCATDLASRGLDVTDITVVINYDFPKYFDDYIHRIGRTGRGEKRGKAFSFLAYDKDEPNMARELLKLAQIANLKYDEFALQNFAAEIIPQTRNDFQSNKFKQSYENYNQKGNMAYSKNSQDQSNFDYENFRYPQENRNNQNDMQYQSFQTQKQNSSFKDTDYNFNLENNEKYQNYDNQQNRNQYQSRNQWYEDRNQKEQKFDTENDRQNYYQKGDNKQFNKTQDRVDRQIRQEQQQYDINNNHDYKDRFYDNDRFDKQNRQDRQFRQKGQDWNQRQDIQQRQIGQDRQEKGQENLINRQDRLRSQNMQGEYNKQDRYDRQNKKYQNDRRDYGQQDRVFQDKQEEPFRQYERTEFEKNRGNKRVNFINQDEDRFENIKEQEMSLKQSQQQNKILFNNNNNQFKWDNQRNDKQEDYWYNQQQQVQQQQRISGTNNKNYENFEEEYKNFRQEECKRQNNNQADIGQNKNRFYQMNEKLDQNNNFHQQQGRFEQGGDRKQAFNNNYGFHENNYKTHKFIRPSIQERQEDDRSQQFRNFNSRNNNHENQGKYYYDQNEKKGYGNFKDKRKFNNDQFEQNNNSRSQNDQQYNDFNRLNKNQIELGNDNYKFKSYRNTQSLEKNEQIRFYNSKQITRNIISSDDLQNNVQKSRLDENKIQRNKIYNTEQNLINIKENQQNINSTQNTEETKKQSLSINENQQGMEEINEIQEYNFNYDPNQSSSENGEIQDQYHFDGYEQINQEQQNEIDHKDDKDVTNQNQSVELKSILKTNVQIPTVIISNQIQEMKEQNPNIDDDLKNQKSHLNQLDENKEDGSDNEFDFTRFSKQLEQESQMKFNTNKFQQLNNITESTTEQQDYKLDS